MLNGRIEIPKLSGWAVDCTVRDVSEAGASLVVPATRTIPDAFRLALSDRGTRPARLVWYRDGRAGVALATLRDCPAPASPHPSTAWDGHERRAGPPAALAPVGAASPSDILARRIAIIAARPAQGERRRVP